MSDLMLNVGNYSKLFLNGGGKIDSQYIRVAPREDTLKIASLDGNDKSLDTPLEIALLSTCTGVVDIRPLEASNILGNAKRADLKLGAAVLKEMQELRFLASAPLSEQNRNTLGHYEGMLKFITDRGNVSRAEIESYLKRGIAEVTREKFNEIDFTLENYSNSYDATLSYNPQTGVYTLSYGGYYTGNVVRKISGTGVAGLLAAMKNNPDFDVRGSAFKLVQEKANHIPALVYESWVDKGLTKVDAVGLAAKTIADYYLNPTDTNYNLLLGIVGLYRRRVEDPVAKAGHDAYISTLKELNETLGDKANGEGFAKSAALSRAAIARNPDYGVFTMLSE
jgi:hypothetical protein